MHPGCSEAEKKAKTDALRQRWEATIILLVRYVWPQIDIEWRHNCNPLMARTLFRPYNAVRRAIFTLRKYSRRSRSRIVLHVLDTVTFVYTQVLVDLIRFQTLDGLRFSYRHPSTVSRQFAVDKVCLSRPNFIRMSSEKVRTVCNNPSSWSGFLPYSLISSIYNRI